jgi:hypothetical protein
VHVLEEPELTEDGEHASEDTVAGATRVSVAELEDPFEVAVSCAVSSAVRVPTEAAKLALT